MKDLGRISLRETGLSSLRDDACKQSSPEASIPLRGYSPFEYGERQALLQVRSFIIKHGLKEVDGYCAQRLHDIAMDAEARVST